VEYGLIVAVVAVIGVIGLGTFGAAQAGYFAGLQPSLAPTVAPTGDVRHRTAMILGCTPSSLTEGDPVTCTVVVQDTSAAPPQADVSPPSPPTVSVTWFLTYGGVPQPPATYPLVPMPGNSSQCMVTFIPPAGIDLVAATYNPDPSLFLVSSAPGTSLTVLPPPTSTPIPSPTATATPTPTATPSPSPTP
jgi:hypothetical protein